MAYKYTAIMLVVDEAGVERVLVLRIHGKGGDLTVGKTQVRRFERSSGIIARQYAAAIGCEQNVFGTANIYQHIVNDHVGSCNPSPRFSGIARLPQSFGSSCVHYVAVARILLEHPSAAS